MDAYSAVQALENIKKRIAALKGFATSLKGSPGLGQFQQELDALEFAQETINARYLKRFVLRSHLNDKLFDYFDGTATQHFPNWSVICALNEDAIPTWLKSATVGTLGGDLIFECVSNTDLDDAKSDECLKWIEAVSISLSTEKKNE